MRREGRSLVLEQPSGAQGWKAPTATGLARHLRAGESRCSRWSTPSPAGEARGATPRRPTPQTPTAPHGWGIGRRSVGRAQERRRAHGDDLGLARPVAPRSRQGPKGRQSELQGLRLTAPEQPRRRTERGASTKELVSVAARFRLGDGPRTRTWGRDGPRRLRCRTGRRYRHRCAGWPTSTGSRWP